MAAYYVNKPADTPQPARRGPPIEGEDESVAIVPYLPWRCPACGDPKPRTRGQRGRVRYHQCQACGLPFRSLEITASEVPNFLPE